MVRSNVHTAKEQAQTGIFNAVFAKAPVGSDVTNAAAHLPVKKHLDVLLATAPVMVRSNVHTAKEQAQTGIFNAVFAKALVGSDVTNAAAHLPVKKHLDVLPATAPVMVRSNVHTAKEPA